MFEGPEYATYIALCRELRLEHKWQAGDWWVEMLDNHNVGRPRTTIRQFHGTPWQIWLPRLDQWLAMLEEAGCNFMIMGKLDGFQHYIRQADGSYEVGEKEAGGYIFRPSRGTGNPDAWEEETGRYATREEAAARLWKAVMFPVEHGTSASNPG